MKKPPDPGGSSCYFYSSYLYLAFYCSSAPNSSFSYYSRTISLASRRNLDLLQSNLLSKLPSPILKILSPTPALHCAVNLSIFVKEKSGKSNLLLYPPNTGAQPLRYGQEFQQRKDGAQPCGFMFALFATDWNRVNSELSQQSHSYGPQAYVLSLGYEESIGLYLSLTTSSRFCEVYSSIQAFSAFVIIYLVVYPLPIYFLSICYLVRMIALLGIWLATCFGKDVTLEVTYLWCSASIIRCIVTIIHVSYCEFYDLCFVSFSTWGCVICNVSFKLDALYSLFEIYVLVSEREPLILILKAIILTDPMDHHIHILLIALRSYLWTDPHLVVFNGRCFDIIIMYFSHNHHLVFYYYLYILDCIFTNYSVTVSDFVQSNFVQVLLSMVCLRSYSCYCHGLFMVRGHKIATLWPKASPLNDPYGSIESPLSWFLLCIALEALGVVGFNPRKQNTPKLGDLVCKEQFTNIAQKVIISLLIVYTEIMQKFLCTNDDVNLLSLLVFMVSEMEYINFVSMAIIPGEWKRVCLTSFSRPCYRPIIWINRQTAKLKVYVLISYMKLSNLESLISIKMSKMEHSNSMSTFLLWFFGCGPKFNYYDSRMGSPWQLEFTSIRPLQSQGKNVNNMHLLLTEASNLNSNSIWFSLLLQALVFVRSWPCIMYALFLDAMNLFFAFFWWHRLWDYMCFFLSRPCAATSSSSGLETTLYVLQQPLRQSSLTGPKENSYFFQRSDCPVFLYSRFLFFYRDEWGNCYL